MRTLNVRLTFILLAIVVVCGAGVHFLHGYQVRRNAHVFKELGEQNIAEAKAAGEAKEARRERKAYKNAMENLNWYVRLVPDDIDAMEELGKIMADRADSIQAFGRAYGMLETILRADAARESVRRRLVDMAIGVGRYQDALQHLQEYLLKDAPDDGELLLLQGRCYMGMSRNEEAVASLKKAIESDPHQTLAYPLLATILRSQYSRDKEADELMAKLVEANPDDAKAHYYLAASLGSKDKDDEALKEVEKALELAPDDKDILLLATRCYMGKKDLENARKCATHGIELHPEVVEMYTAMRDIETMEDHRDKAIAILLQGIKATERNPQLLWHLANLHIDAKELKEAKEILDELKTNSASKAYTEFLNARIEYVQGNWLPARRGLERARSAFMALPGAAGQMVPLIKQLDMWIAQCCSRLGDREQQIEALRHALKLDPFYAPARAALTQAMLATGDVEQAMGQFEQLAKTANVGQGGAISYAKMLILQTLRQPPQERDWRPVEEVLDKAEKAMPDAVDIPILRAEMLTAQERLDDAEKLLQKTKEANPDEPKLLAVLAALAERRGDWDRTETLLAEAKKVKGDTVDYRLAQAQYLVRRKGKESIDEVHQLLENDEQFSDADRINLWNGLLNAAIQADDREQVKLLARRIAGKDPNNLQSRYVLFEQALRSDPPDMQGMDVALQEIEKVAGQDAFWQYGQAAKLSLQVKEKADPEKLLDKALVYLTRARDLRQNWAQIPLLMAGIYDQQGKSELALKLYLEAIDLGDHNPNAIRRAVQLLFQSQQYAQADQLLQRMEKLQVPLSPEMGKASVEIALKQGEFDRALEMARKSSVTESTNPGEHLWMGQMLSILGRRAEKAGQADEAKETLGNAEKSLRRAVELDPKNPAGWVALVRFLAESKELDRAKPVVEDAAKNIPAKEAPIALGLCYEALADREAAEEKYEGAFAAAPQDPAVVRAVADFYCRTDKLVPAEAKLQLIVDGKVESPKADMMWARRQLAKIYGGRQGYQNQQKAREFIMKNLADPEASPEDRRVLVGLDAQDPKRIRRDDAVRALEALQRDKKATPEDLLALARMYNDKGEWVRAAAVYREVIGAAGGDPRYLAAYIGALLDHDDTSDSEIYLQQLEKKAPSHIQTVTLRANLLAAKKDFNAALELLERFLGDEKATPADPNDRMRVVAEQMEQLALRLKKKGQNEAVDKFAAKAESLYRQYVDQKPNQVWALFAFYARLGRFDEALDVLEKNWENGNPLILSQTAALLMRDGTMSEEQNGRLEEVTRAALKRFDQPAPLVMVMADVYSRQKRFADAEESYKEILEKDANNVYAMNNLAVLLALRGDRLDEALTLVNKALEKAGPVAAMLDSRATVYLALKQPDKALADMNEALAEAETPVRLFHQAQALAASGQEDAAAEAMKKALEMGLTKETLHPLEATEFEKLLLLTK